MVEESVKIRGKSSYIRPEWANAGAVGVSLTAEDRVARARDVIP